MLIAQIVKVDPARSICRAKWALPCIPCPSRIVLLIDFLSSSSSQHITDDSLMFSLSHHQSSSTLVNHAIFQRVKQKL